MSGARERWNATAVVLAGGSSTRMGRDKALLELDGRPLIERLVRGLEASFAEVLVSSRGVDDYAFLGCRVVADPVSGQGPMRGVATALLAARHDPVFFTPCDQVDVPLALATLLFRQLGDAEAAVPRHADGKLEPLLSVLRRGMAEALERALARGERRIIDVYARSRVRYVDLPDDWPVSNLNTEADYREALRRRAPPRIV
jgi:molybdopterin-guanine dinucleotide biosynthesis protein A